MRVRHYFVAATSLRGLLQPFTPLLTGHLTLGTSLGAGPLGGLLDNDYIRSTSLMKTKELAPFSDFAQLRQKLSSVGTELYLQPSLSNSSKGGASGLSRLTNDFQSLSLSNAIENMFRNLTISLVTDPAFL